MKHIILTLILTSTLFSQMPEYNRSYFKHWVDLDKNCRDARQEVLIEESLTDGVVYTSRKECKVAFGMWHGKFNDVVIYNAKDLDVDHLVPLKNAWISGAWRWTDEKREEYANYLEDPEHLIAVSSSANRSKGAKSPDQWLPKNKKYWVPYCRAWCNIKVKWGLTVTRDELETLESILRLQEGITYPSVRY